MLVDAEHTNDYYSAIASGYDKSDNSSLIGVYVSNNILNAYYSDDDNFEIITNDSSINSIKKTKLF